MSAARCLFVSDLHGREDRYAKLYEQIRDLYRSHCLEEATKRYQIGRLVAKCLADQRAYGERVMVKISIALHSYRERSYTEECTPSYSDSAEDF